MQLHAYYICIWCILLCNVFLEDGHRCPSIALQNVIITSTVDTCIWPKTGLHYFNWSISKFFMFNHTFWKLAAAVKLIKIIMLKFVSQASVIRDKLGLSSRPAHMRSKSYGGRRREGWDNLRVIALRNILFWHFQLSASIDVILTSAY